MAITPPVSPLPRSDYQVVHHSRCRVCLHPVSTVVDLGYHQLNTFPLTPDGVIGPAVPLVLTWCARCLLFQLADTAPRELLYREYWYRSGISEMMRDHLAKIAAAAISSVQLGAHDTVMDIGANDGTLLGFFRSWCPARRVAVEPARNLHASLHENALPEIVDGFFPEVRLPTHAKAAKVITSIAMFYDLEWPDEFVRGIRSALATDGVWIFEVAYFPWMLERGVFDVICHEHIEYYTLFSIALLLQRHELKIVDVELNWTNGRSVLVYAMHERATPSAPRFVGGYERAAKLLIHENESITPGKIAQYRMKVESLKRRIRELVLDALDRGERVDLYGASTKGNTLLQYCELTYREIRRALERSPDKLGRYTVGSGIPIIDEGLGRVNDPAELWLCPIWQFKDQVIGREYSYLEGGGRILFPMPEPEIVCHHGVGRGLYAAAGGNEEAKGAGVPGDDREPEPVGASAGGGSAVGAAEAGPREDGEDDGLRARREGEDEGDRLGRALAGGESEEGDEHDHDYYRASDKDPVARRGDGPQDHHHDDGAADQAKVSGPAWVRVSEGHPPPHARYVVHRGEAFFVATPCYGMHAPWWVPRNARGKEDDPIAMLDTDRWRPWP